MLSPSFPVVPLPLMRCGPKRESVIVYAGSHFDRDTSTVPVTDEVRAHSIAPVSSRPECSSRVPLLMIVVRSRITVGVPVRHTRDTYTWTMDMFDVAVQFVVVHEKA